MSGDLYEVHALRYASLERRASDNFLGGDPHDGPMPMDYFVWVLINGDRKVVVDTGFDAAVAAKRGRVLTVPVEDGLRALGIRHEEVSDVIITHLHYDHAGNNALFPNARFHLQDREMQFATGRCMCHPVLGSHFEADDVVAMVRRNFDRRLCFHDGVTEFAPGITLHHVGGHTMGTQVVRVLTRRGFVVLASDAAHYYAHVEQGRVFPAVYNIGDTLEGYGTISRLASGPAHVIPGHDPAVLRRFPASRADLDGIAARVDADPLPF